MVMRSDWLPVCLLSIPWPSVATEYIRIPLAENNPGILLEGSRADVGEEFCAPGIDSVFGGPRLNLPDKEVSTQTRYG